MKPEPIQTPYDDEVRRWKRIFRWAMLFPVLLAVLAILGYFVVHIAVQQRRAYWNDQWATARREIQQGEYDAALARLQRLWDSRLASSSTREASRANYVFLLSEAGRFEELRDHEEILWQQQEERFLAPWRVARMSWLLGDLARARREVEPLLQVVRQRREEDTVDPLPVPNLVAVLLILTEDYEDLPAVAAAGLRYAEWTVQRHTQRASLETSEGWTVFTASLAVLAAREGDHDEVRARAQQVEDFVEEFGGPSGIHFPRDFGDATAWLLLVLALEAVGDFERAAECHDRLMSILARIETGAIRGNIQLVYPSHTFRIWARHHAPLAARLLEERAERDGEGSESWLEAMDLYARLLRAGEQTAHAEEVEEALRNALPAPFPRETPADTLNAPTASQRELDR